jgi:hypothetical protein
LRGYGDRKEDEYGVLDRNRKGDRDGREMDTRTKMEMRMRWR